MPHNWAAWRRLAERSGDGSAELPHPRPAEPRTWPAVRTGFDRLCNFEHQPTWQHRPQDHPIRPAATSYLAASNCRLPTLPDCFRSPHCPANGSGDAGSDPPNDGSASLPGPIRDPIRAMGSQRLLESTPTAVCHRWYRPRARPGWHTALSPVSCKTQQLVPTRQCIRNG